MPDTATPTPVRADPPPRGRCGCGYDLRGIDSSVCPECGKSVEVYHDLPQSMIDYARPVRWPARAAFWSMLVLIVAEAFLQFPASVGLFFWVCTYFFIAIRYLWRSHQFWLARRRYHVDLRAAHAERVIVRRARIWLAVGLFLSFFCVPQILLILTELPSLTHQVQRVYEREPLNAPHKLNWHGLHQVDYMWVYPSGVYLGLGPRGVAYCPAGPGPDWRFNEYVHIVGSNWYVSLR